METDAEHSAVEKIHKMTELLFSFSTPLNFLDRLALPELTRLEI